MEILKAIVLGIVQGITEFFPVSSSGHLVLVPFLFKWDYVPIFYSVTLHFATLMSLVTIFYRDIGRIIKAFFTGLFSKNVRRSNPYFKLFVLIIIAEIPAAIVGYFLQDRIEGFFSKPLYVSIFLLVTAMFLFVGEYFGKKYEKRYETSNLENNDSPNPMLKRINPEVNDQNSMIKSPELEINNQKSEIIENNSEVIGLNSKIKGLRFISAAVIGIGQAIAVLPGISRSGSTISFARFFGIRREECVKFSMLLSIPIILGAFILETAKSYKEITLQDPHLFINITVGFVFAYLTGLFAVKFLLRFSKARNLNYFAIYCIVLAIIIFILSFFR